MRANLFLIALIFFAAIVTAQTVKSQRPNIVIFLVDDMGWQDTSVPFWSQTTPLNKRYRTPNMERLAASGVKMTNAYATPVCTPTRVSMLTGMNAAHHHVTNWTSPFRNNNTDAQDDQMTPATWNINGLSHIAGIPSTVHATTFPALLKDAGYFTIHVGKAHWGSSGTPGSNPYNLGFMVNVAGHSAGHPQSFLSEDNYGNVPLKPTIQAVPDLQEYHGTGTFLTEALTLEALKALDAPIKNKQPFFLHLSHYAVHVPIMGDPRFLQKYLDAGLDTIEAKYATLVEGMDKSLGDLMNYLEQKKVEQNTVIIFLSDNGGLSTIPWRGGAIHTQNLPLKAGKGSMYEGGIRNPMIVRWPGEVKPNTINTNQVIVDDLLPSILEMAKLKNYKTIQTIDGKSFVSLLKNPNTPSAERELVWHYPDKWIANDGPGINYKSAIRKGDWKLIYHMRTGKKELYNLKDDIGELNDLATAHPDKVKALSTALSNQLRKWDAPMPIVKATGKPVPWPDEL
jgi:arylsulfatase A-like enzyme